MLNRIKQIKANLRVSSEINSSMIKLRSLVSTEYNLQAELIEAFLVLNTHDKAIASAMDKIINSKEETEIHNVIASLSYAIPAYGIPMYPLYYADKVKVALASVIMVEYIKVYGAREDQTIKVIRGRSIGVDTHYVQALDTNKVEKNLLYGIEYIPGVINTKQIKTKPGAPRLKPCKVLKETARAVSSMALEIVDDISSNDILNELMKGKDYLSVINPKGRVQEHRLAMKDRFETYAEIFGEIQEASKLGIYLTVYFCYRNRMYYDVPLQVLNPQSKIGKYVYQAHKPRLLTEEDYNELAFAAASSTSRCTLAEGRAMFEANEDSIREELLAEESFLDLTYNKRLLNAIDDYRVGLPSKFLLLLDYTTGGLIHFSSGYTQEKQAMKLSNIIEGETMQDTHQTMANAIIDVVGLEISRSDAKVINQSILAGVSPKSATEKFNKHFGEEVITEDQLVKVGRAVYGGTFDAFHSYNKWGKSLVDNDNSSLMFTMSDGVKCMSSAYIKGQEVKVYVPTTSGMKQMSIHRNMPLLIDNNSHTPLLVGTDASVKMSGWLANTTHAHDGKAIRKIAVAIHKAGQVGIFIHDNIGAFGSVHADVVRPTAKADVQENYDNKSFLDIQRQVSENRKGASISVMSYSVNDVEDFEISDNFLQA